MSARTLALASAFLPPLCGLLAFALLGVPEAHAAAAPSFSAEVLHLAGETMSQLLCSDGLTWGAIFDVTPLPPGHPPRTGAFPAIGLGLLGLAAVVVIALGRMRLANENKRLDVAQRLIEQGMEPPANLLANPARNDLRKGIVLLFAGGGVLAAGLMTGDRGMAAGALVPEFIGAGYLVSYWLASRTQRGEPRA